MVNKVIPLRAVPNQSLSVRLAGRAYAIRIDTRRDRLYISAAIDGVQVMNNRALLSFAPVAGDLMLIDTEGRDGPAWEQLGSRFQLMYWPAPQ